MKLTPSCTFRVSVQVALRASTSTSPDCKAVNRSLAERATYLTFPASPKTAAATALQMSTSKPCHWPVLSGNEKPAKLGLTPQSKVPRDLTTSSLDDCAQIQPGCETNKAAIPATRTLLNFMTGTLRFACGHRFGRCWRIKPAEPTASAPTLSSCFVWERQFRVLCQPDPLRRRSG